MNVSHRALQIRRLLLGASVVAAVAVFWWARSRGEDIFGAFFLAFWTILLIGVGLWLFRQGLQEALDHRALKKLNLDDRKPGSWVAVTGRAVALEDEMKATLSNRPALACSYEILERVASQRTNTDGSRSAFSKRLFEGYHQVSTGIETDAGLVPLRALLDLGNLEKTGLGHADSNLDAIAERVPKKFPRTAARAHLAAQAHNRFGVDWKYHDPEDSGTLLSKEWVLPPNEEVCVFGCWDGTSLVPNAMRVRGLPVYPGTPEHVRDQLSGGSKLWLGLSLIPFSLAGWLLIRSLF